MDSTKTEKYTLSKGSGNLLRSMKQSSRSTPTSPRACRSSTRSCAIFAICSRSTRTPATASSTTRSSSRRTRTRRRRRRTRASSSSRSARRASTEDEKAAVTQGYMGLVFKYGEQQDVIKFLPPDRTDGLEFWITNKIREIRDKGDDIHHKIGVLTGDDEIKPSDNNLVPTQHGQVLDAGHHHAELPLLYVLGRGPEGRRRGDPGRPRRPHHHAAGQGPHREGAPAHRPVRDEGQGPRRLRQRRQREGERRDDERDAEHARAREAARGLRHRRSTRTSSSTCGSHARVVVPTAAGIAGRRAPAGARGAGRPALHGRRGARRHELPVPLPRRGRSRCRSRRASRSRPTSSPAPRCRSSCARRPRRCT